MRLATGTVGIMAPSHGASLLSYADTADQRKTGSRVPAFWPFPDQCEQGTPCARAVMTYALVRRLQTSRWVRDGVRLRARNDGCPERRHAQARVVLDQFGNATGGVRTPYLEAPVATYYTSTKGPGLCGNLAHEDAFDWARLNALYGSPGGYAAKVSEAVDRLVRERWLTESDGRRIKAEVVVPATSSR
jgi:hypothetical protein